MLVRVRKLNSALARNVGTEQRNNCNNMGCIDGEGGGDRIWLIVLSESVADVAESELTQRVKAERENTAMLTQAEISRGSGEGAGGRERVRNNGC